MLIKLATRNLFRNPRRTLAVLLTIAMGTGSLFIFHGFNNGIMNQYRDNCIHARYGHGQINTRGYRDQVFAKPWEHWIADWAPLAERLRTITGVELLFPRLEFSALLTNGTVTISGHGQAIDGEAESGFFNTLNIVEGQTLGAQVDGILLGKGLASGLDAHPGKVLTVMVQDINGQLQQANLTVTGIFHTGSKEFDDVMFRVPLRHGQKLLKTNRIETLALGLSSLDDWPAVANLVNEEFVDLEAVPFAKLDEVYYQHSVDWLAAQFGVIHLIILGIVILGIFNTVSTSVLERKQEIGNLRANGESKSDIMLLLVWEGITLGVLGAGLGLIVALGLDFFLLREGILMPPAPGLTRQFRVLIEFQPSMALITFGLGSSSALLATMLASARVVRASIGDALRSV
ncbi:ABC transporter permease [Methylomonas sp. SURF-1]|uniref:ABC transporter permease n=1 Tax=Methylomonas aurea TaxID=2952224 RepID=A0ABT1UC17_9GAMM|nr:FtsX-like permease family protein [Methylomonas sp. SURF-1]MCQ8179759.1 ABC transporter permease [Methylomonas sp. SURF-1]